MVEKKGANLKAKGKGSTSPPEATGDSKRKASGGRLVKSLKRVAVRSFVSVARPTAVPSRPTTPLDCHCYDSNCKPLEAAVGKPSESKKPYKKPGGNKGMAFMQSMFEAYVKSQKRASKSKKRKKCDYDSSDSSDSE
jgi:hypothetical protein